ncbi:hypothetical protein CTP10_R53100 [Cupriavidus sp. P-10]|nr:hypothetical protein CTP10_R53100 [Cupriavidus sp. P-10]
MPLIARERGEFEKNLASKGIKVEWVGPFPNHAPSLQAVVGGSADFGFWGSTTPALAAMIAGSPLVFAQFNVYGPRSTAIIVKKSSGISSVRDLAGKKVAVNRSGLGEFLLVAALEKNGIDRSRVEFVYLNPPDAAPAFGQGKVDAWSMCSPGVDIARQQFDAKTIFFEGSDLDFLIDYSSLVTARRFATENSALVRAVIDAYRIEGKWLDENGPQAELFAQKEGKYSDAVRDHLVSLQQVLRRRRQGFPGGLPARRRLAVGTPHPAEENQRRRLLGPGVRRPTSSRSSSTSAPVMNRSRAACWNWRGRARRSACRRRGRCSSMPCAPAPAPAPAGQGGGGGRLALAEQRGRSGAS